MFKSAHILHTLIALAFLACGGAAPHGAARAATAEPLDIEPDVLAKLAMEKARAASRRGAQSAAAKGRQGDSPDAECGAVSIGNVIGNNNIGFGPTDVSVVIVGDVINANNNCK